MRVDGWVFGEEGWEFAYWKCFPDRLISYFRFNVTWLSESVHRMLIQVMFLS